MSEQLRLNAHTIAEEIATHFCAETTGETVVHRLTHRAAVAIVRLTLRNGRRFTVQVEEKLKGR